MTESKDWPGSRSLQDQLERAALSVSNNIAEGFERGTTNELLAFIYIARGSAGEVRKRSWIDFRRIFPCGNVRCNSDRICHNGVLS